MIPLTLSVASLKSDRSPIGLIVSVYYPMAGSKILLGKSSAVFYYSIKFLKSEMDAEKLQTKMKADACVVLLEDIIKNKHVALLNSKHELPMIQELSRYILSNLKLKDVKIKYIIKKECENYL